MPNQPRVRIVCPACSTAMQTPADAAHQPHRCPKCGSDLRPSARAAGHQDARAAYERWPVFWQGMALGALSGALVFLAGLAALGVWAAWGR